jgi:hypothetical protein
LLAVLWLWSYVNKHEGKESNSKEAAKKGGERKQHVKHRMLFLLAFFFFCGVHPLFIAAEYVLCCTCRRLQGCRVPLIARCWCELAGKQKC